MGPVPSHQVLADAFERQRRRRARDRVVAVPAGAPRRPQGAGPARRAGAFPSSNLLGGGSQPRAHSRHPLLPRLRREEEPRPGRRPLDSSLRGRALPPPRPDLLVAAAEPGASALGAAVPCHPAEPESPEVMVCAVAGGA